MLCVNTAVCVCVCLCVCVGGKSKITPPPNQTKKKKKTTPDPEAHHQPYPHTADALCVDGCVSVARRRETFVSIRDAQHCGVGTNYTLQKARIPARLAGEATLSRARARRACMHFCACCVLCCAVLCVCVCATSRVLFFGGLQQRAAFTSDLVCVWVGVWHYNICGAHCAN